MKISEAGDQISIDETPGCLWVFGLFFGVIGGLFVYGSLGGFTNRDEVPVYAIWLAFVMGAVGIAVGIWIILRAPVTNVVIDRQKKIISHTRRGLFGKTEDLYHIDQVKEFCVIEDKDDEGSSIWSLGYELSSGEIIAISSLQSHDEKFKRNFVFRANEFMQKQMPSYAAVDQLDE